MRVRVALKFCQTLSWPGGALEAVTALEGWQAHTASDREVGRGKLKIWVQA